MVDMRGWAPGGGVRETCAARNGAVELFIVKQ